MKNLLILATMLLSFSFANAQSEIYQKDGYYYNEVGKFEGGKIYQKDGYYYNEIGKTDGGGGAASGFLLLL